MKQAILGLFVGTAFLLVATPARSGDDDKWWYGWFGDPRQGSAQQIADDEKLLKDAKIETDAAGLLAYLATLTPSKGDEEKIVELFKQLETPKFQEREQATAALTAMGPKAIPVLKRLLPGPTLEVRMRVERCIKVLEQKSPAMLSAAAVRLLKSRKADGLVASLMQFAPHSPDDTVSEEVLDAVFSLGVRKGKIDPAIAAALSDTVPARRAVAAVLAGRFGNDEERKAAVALLEDKSAEVRFRAAQGLVARGDRRALPVLVDVLKNGPHPVAERAEELLLQIADKMAPKLTLGFDDASRAKCHDAWKDWLQANESTADLGKADLGFPLPSADYRVRAVVKQFIDLIGKSGAIEREKIARLTDVPFYQTGPGQKTLNTREQWEEELKTNLQNPEGLTLKASIKAVKHLMDYLDNAKEQEKQVLSKFSPAEVRIAQVLMEVSFMNQNFSMTLPLYVRVSGARGRLFGIGEPTEINVKN